MVTIIFFPSSALRFQNVNHMFYSVLFILNVSLLDSVNAVLYLYGAVSEPFGYLRNVRIPPSTFWR